MRTGRRHQPIERAIGALPDEASRRVIIALHDTAGHAHPHLSHSLFAGTGEVARGYAFGTAGRGAVLCSEDEGGHWHALIENLPALRQLAAVPA
jgi:hypothetical protein